MNNSSDKNNKNSEEERISKAIHKAQSQSGHHISPDPLEAHEYELETYKSPEDKEKEKQEEKKESRYGQQFKQQLNEMSPEDAKKYKEHLDKLSSEQWKKIEETQKKVEEAALILTAAGLALPAAITVLAEAGLAGSLGLGMSGTSLTYQMYDRKHPSTVKLDPNDANKIDALLEALHMQKGKDGKYHQETFPASTSPSSQSPETKKELDEMNVKIDALLKAVHMGKGEDGKYHLQNQETDEVKKLSKEDKEAFNEKNGVLTVATAIEFFEKADRRANMKQAALLGELSKLQRGGAISEPWLLKLLEAFDDSDDFETLFQQFFYRELDLVFEPLLP